MSPTWRWWGFFIYLLRKPGRLSYYLNGRWWLTWLSVAVITLMDELTSVFYAPAEAYRFIGSSAIIFIAFTAIFVHYMTTRLVEIAEILEHHGLIGGGVYSFSYLVLGPLVSFVAVASIMVDYILTACISAVSAVLNATSFFHLPHHVIIALVLITIWVVAGLNILGIKENARVTFTIFIFAALIFVTLIISGILTLDSASLGRLKQAAVQTAADLHSGLLVSELSYLYRPHRLLYPGLLRGGIRAPDRRPGAELAGDRQGLYLPGPHRGIWSPPSWPPWPCPRPSISICMKATSSPITPPS